MKSLAVLLILPAVVYGGMIFGGGDTVKRCAEVLVDDVKSDKVPDMENCAQYYVCNKWFQSKMRCTSGTHFSAVQKICAEPCEAACDTSLPCLPAGRPEISTGAATSAPSVVKDTDASSPAADESNGTATDLAATDDSGTGASVTVSGRTGSSVTDFGATGASVTVSGSTGSSVTNFGATGASDADARKTPSTDASSTKASSTKATSTDGPSIGASSTVSSSKGASSTVATSTGASTIDAQRTEASTTHATSTSSSTKGSEGSFFG